jgi:hypothetical protein
MGNIPVQGEHAPEGEGAPTFEMKLEIVVIPVSDVDRAKRFYGALGWRLDIEAGDPSFTDEFVRAIRNTTRA